MRVCSHYGHRLQCKSACAQSFATCSLCLLNFLDPQTPLFKPAPTTPSFKTRLTPLEATTYSQVMQSMNNATKQFDTPADNKISAESTNCRRRGRGVRSMCGKCTSCVYVPGFDFSSKMQGLLLGSFYWGCAAIQIPAGNGRF